MHTDAPPPPRAKPRIPPLWTSPRAAAPVGFCNFRIVNNPNHSKAAVAGTCAAGNAYTFISAHIFTRFRISGTFLRIFREYTHFPGATGRRRMHKPKPMFSENIVYKAETAKKVLHWRGKCAIIHSITRNRLLHNRFQKLQNGHREVVCPCCPTTAARCG